MKRVCCVAVLLAAVAVLLGGCPTAPSDGFVTGPSASSASGESSGSAGSGGGDGGSSTGGSDGSDPAGGSEGEGSDGDGLPDALSVSFSGCEESLEGDTWRAEVLYLVNLERAAYGHDALVWNQTLEEQATQYACEMIYYDFFEHENPVTGSNLADRAEEFGYEYVWIGENLAAGQRTPEEAVTAWLDSPCHRKNLLHPAFTELGVGVRVGGTYGYYWVQEFGRPVSAGSYTGLDFAVPGCEDGSP